MKIRHITAAFTLAALGIGSAQADTAVGLRAGTLGVGLDFNVGLTETLNARVGYSILNYDDTIEETDVTYDGELDFGTFSALLDWHVFGGGFRLSFGGVGGDMTVDLTGKPTQDTFEIGDEIFDAEDVGQLKGKLELGNSVAPYIGIGWGNTVDAEDRVTFLFDIGAIYAGEPEVNLTATCGPAIPAARCAELQREVQVEEDELKEDANGYEWYPVISLGFAVRF